MQTFTLKEIMQAGMDAYAECCDGRDRLAKSAIRSAENVGELEDQNQDLRAQRDEYMGRMVKERERADAAEAKVKAFEEREESLLIRQAELLAELAIARHKRKPAKETKK